MEIVEDDSTEIPTLPEEEIEQLNIRDLKADLDIIKVQIEDNKVDTSVIKKYEEKVFVHCYLKFEFLMCN